MMMNAEAVLSTEYQVGKGWQAQNYKQIVAFGGAPYDRNRFVIAAGVLYKSLVVQTVQFPF